MENSGTPDALIFITQNLILLVRKLSVLENASNVFDYFLNAREIYFAST